MHHRTSSRGFVWQISADPLQALLYDFDIDHDDLKSAHLEFLDTKVLGAIQAGSRKKWRFKVEGRASRSGTEKHNLGLSQKRAQKAYEYVTKKAHGDLFAEAQWVGEDRAARDGQKDGKENMVYRAVLVDLCGEDKPIPPPPPPPVIAAPPKPKTLPPNKPFQIRMLDGASVTYTLPLPGPIQKVMQAGVSRDSYTFEIRDVEANVSCVYLFEAMGKTLGPSLSVKNVGGGKTLGGDWNDFSGPRWISVEDFEGPATLESAGVSHGAASHGSTTFMFRPLHWYSVAFGFRIPNFKTGRTVGSPGVGVASTTGSLKLLSKAAGSK
ncbi:MAG TPA: OmpA family protein [Bryobacteraceae bacterium]|nr:OmpA family protein [Bryobacteraceae bacterium]